MDGTKAAMEPNAEETQDEGQESRGRPDPSHVLLRLETFASAPA